MGCGAGGRDGRDLAHDLEGTVSSSTVERLAGHFDLSRAPVVVSVASAGEQTFGASDQPALEASLRDALQPYDGARLSVTQQVYEESSASTGTLTLTLALEQQGTTRYVPVIFDLDRSGRRATVTRLRMMAPGR